MRVPSSSLRKTREASRSSADIEPGSPFDRLRRAPWLLWSVFAAIHVALLIGVLPFIVKGTSGGDVSWYQGVAHHALKTGEWPVFGRDWVYPAGAVLIVMLPAVLGFAFYQVLWLVFIAASNAVAVWFLIDRGTRRRDLTATWFYLATLAVLSPVVLMRIEGFTAPAVVVALLFLSSRPRVAGVLLAAATWVKVWPAAVIAAALVASSKRWAILVTSVGVSVIVAAVVFLFGGGSHLTSFVTAQDSRPLQLEAPLATPWVWMSMFGVPGARIFHDHPLNTEEVTGPGDSWLVAHGTMLMLLVMLALLVLLALAMRRLSIFARPTGRELDLVLLGSLGLASAFVVFNKVVSPQYLLWLTPIVAVGLLSKPVEWRFPGVLLVVTSVVTTLVYPVFYDQLMAAHPAAVILLAVRNLLLLAAFAWAVWKVARVAFVRPTVPLGTRPFDVAVRNISY
ncbi:glycosyltransferase family 87 protein [Frondihabitans cladoniiphilus]|uniref:Glycosyltransferase family 87 protein n=1 Tax=Frondihabitans cladoniiphilus TaxID=715785 RepID=A0ABP8W1Y6_9MICO